MALSILRREKSKDEYADFFLTDNSKKELFGFYEWYKSNRKSFHSLNVITLTIDTNCLNDSISEKFATVVNEKLNDINGKLKSNDYLQLNGNQILANNLEKIRTFIRSNHPYLVLISNLADESISVNAWRSFYYCMLEESPESVILIITDSKGMNRLKEAEGSTAGMSRTEAITTGIGFYHDSKNYRLESSISEPDVIFMSFRNFLNENSCRYDDKFIQKITEYINEVYPRPDLRNYGNDFVEDLYDRVLKLYYSKGGSGSKVFLTGDCIPEYVKREKNEDKENSQEVLSAESPEASMPSEPKPGEQAKKGTDSDHKSAEETSQKTASEDKSDPLNFKFEDHTGEAAVNNSTLNEKNIIINSISTLTNFGENFYYFEDKNNEGHYDIVSGVSQLEPGTKYFINLLASQGKRVDNILSFTSKEAAEEPAISTRTETDCKTGTKKVIKTKLYKSAYDFYKDSITYYICESPKYSNDEHVTEKQLKDNSESEINPYTLKHNDVVEKQINLNATVYEYDKDKVSKLYKSSLAFENFKYDNDKTITDPLYELYNEIIELSEKGKYKINIYLDSQGGQRAFINIINALLSIQNNTTINIIDIIATKFIPGKHLHEIFSVKDLYSINDFVSAVNAFTSFGRGDLLSKYFEENKGNESDRVITKEIKNISDALSISDPISFNEHITKLSSLISPTRESNKSDKGITEEVSELSFATTLIKNSFNQLFEQTHQIFDEIQWFIDHKFYQQALLFIEDKMPEWFLTEFYDNITFFNKDNSYPITSSEIPAKDISGQWYESIYNKLFYKVLSEISIKSDNEYDQNCLSLVIDNNLESIRDFIGEKKSEIINCFQENDFTVTGFINFIKKENKEQYNNFFGEWLEEFTEIQKIPGLQYLKIENDIVKLIQLQSDDHSLLDNIRNNLSTNNNPPHNLYNIYVCILNYFNNPRSGSLYDLLNESFSNYLLEKVLQKLKKPSSNKKFMEKFNKIHYHSEQENDYGRFHKEILQDYIDSKRLRITHGQNSISNLDELIQINSYSDLTLISLAQEIEESFNIESYITFRNFEKDFEKDGPYIPHVWEHSILSDIDFHSINDSVGHPIDYRTFDSLKDRKKYELSNKKLKGWTWKIKIKSQLANIQENKRNYNLLLRLHGALKQERNNSAHASEHGIRLSIDVIEIMLQKYVDLCKELYMAVNTGENN